MDDLYLQMPRNMESTLSGWAKRVPETQRG